MKSIRIFVILTALITTACTGGTVSPSASASGPPAATASSLPSATLAATPRATPSANPPSLLEGVWTTAEITCDQALATMHEAGFTDAQIAAGNWACSQPFQYRLRFFGDQFAQFQKDRDGAWEKGSGRSFRLVDDHTLFLTDGQQTLTFTLVENVLTFVSISESSDATNDLDGQVHGAAIFLTAPYTKEP